MHFTRDGKAQTKIGHYRKVHLEGFPCLKTYPK